MAGSLARKKSSKPQAAAVNGGESVNPLNLADIQELFVLMRENDIAELQLEQANTKIHIISKGQHHPVAASVVPMMTGVPQVGMVGMHPTHAAPPVVPMSTDNAQPASNVAGEGGTNPSDPPNLKTIYSPMVGTFYSAPAPDAPSFVRAGETVNEETVLCIIEAMKLMNEIKAETKGRIYKIMVENGVPVEYNQPLFLIEP